MIYISQKRKRLIIFFITIIYVQSQRNVEEYERIRDQVTTCYDENKTLKQILLENNMEYNESMEINGGWSTDPIIQKLNEIQTSENIITRPLREYEDINGVSQQFDQPIIFRGKIRSNSQKLKPKMHKQILDCEYGKKTVQVLQPISRPFNFQGKNFSDYLRYMDERRRFKEEQILEQTSKDLLYLFGSNKWKFFEDFQPISAQNCLGEFGIGASAVGAAVHSHAEVFNEVYYGKKIWLIAPPDKEVNFQKDQPGIKYLLSEKYKEDDNVKIIVQNAGDIVYLPTFWQHTIINVGDTLFVGCFSNYQPIEPYDNFFSTCIKENQDNLYACNMRPHENYHYFDDFIENLEENTFDYHKLCPEIDQYCFECNPDKSGGWSVQAHPLIQDTVQTLQDQHINVNIITTNEDFLLKELFIQEEDQIVLYQNSFRIIWEYLYKLFTKEHLLCGYSLKQLFLIKYNNHQIYSRKINFQDFISEFSQQNENQKLPQDVIFGINYWPFFKQIPRLSGLNFITYPQFNLGMSGSGISFYFNNNTNRFFEIIYGKVVWLIVSQKDFSECKELENLHPNQILKEKLYLNKNINLIVQTQNEIVQIPNKYYFSYLNIYDTVMISHNANNTIKPPVIE